jgi:biopolymer transport protein ExbB/biopolymer transport protein TolQ
MEGRKMGQIGRIVGAGFTMALVSTPAFAQEGAGLDMIEMFEQMGPTAMAIAVVLFIMSFWSVGVAIERIYTFNQATKQSKLYAPQVAKHLKEGRLKEAIALSSAKEYRYSHLAKVVLAGLQEYQFQQDSAGGAALNRDDLLDTVRRSIQRATALTSNDLKKGVSSLATIGATAPFVGLLGTVVGVINAFVGIASTGSGGIGAVSAGIAEALVETALGLFVAIPAVWFYNYLTGRLEYFNVEMDNSSSELLDYFIRKTAH